MASTMTAQRAAPPPAAPTTAAASTETNATNPKKKKRLITPNGKSSAVPDPRMTVEKGIVDELLLVCSVIGTTSSDGDELVPVDDCLNWLQDLQRALRRDDDLYRPISLLIGKWKVVPQKLFPLIMTCRYDSQIVLTVVKILVILTKPLAENTKRAGRMIIDTASSKKDPAVVQEQVKLRENALEQAEMLMEYKRAVAHHASHYQQKEQGTGLLSVLVSLLAEPLSKSGASRTDADHLTIELVLHLIRNLLSAEPLLNSK
jgi:timeless